MSNQNIETSVLLSICLPTYNQPQAVENFLKSVISQLTKEVEIVIVDDSSTDETKKIVTNYLSKGQVKYFRGEGGGGLDGIDKAVVSTIQKAQGKYVWTFGDEILEEGAVQKVLSLLKKYPDMALIWANSRDFENTSIAFDFGGDKFFRDANEVLEQIGVELSFISATIFDRSKALRGKDLVKNYYGSTYSHLYMVLTSMSYSGRFYFLSHPYVVGPIKPLDFNFGSHKDIFKVCAVDLFRVMNSTDFKDKFNRRSVKKAISIQFNGMWRGILVARAKGIKTNYGSPSPKIPTLLRYYWNHPQILIAVPLLLLPRALDQALYKLYKRFSYKK